MCTYNLFQYRVNNQICQPLRIFGLENVQIPVSLSFDTSLESLRSLQPSNQLPSSLMPPFRSQNAEFLAASLPTMQFAPCAELQ